MTLTTANKILDDIASTHELDDDQAIRLAEVQVASARAAAEQAKADALGRLASAADGLVHEFTRVGAAAAKAGYALASALTYWEANQRPARPHWSGMTPRGE